MTLPFFAGSSAQSHADTMLKWRQIWSAEENADKQRELEKERWAFQADENAKERTFQERLAEENWDRNVSWEMGKLALERMPNMSLDQQIALYENFKGRGHIITPLLENSLNTGFYNNWEDAANMVDELFTAAPGTMFTPYLTKAAAEQVANRMGMKGEERDAFMADVDKALSERAKEGEEWNAMQWDSARTAIQQGRANLAQTGAETDQIRAHTSGLWLDMDIKNENREADMRIRNATADKLESEAAIAAFQADAGYEFVQAELAQAWANVEDIENRNDLFRETFDFMVRSAAAKADIDEEDARHQIATGFARDALAIADGTLRESQLQAAIAATYADVDLTYAQSRLVGQQTLNEELRGRATRIEIATMLSESGQTELLRSLSNDLLGDFIPAEDLENVTSDLVQIASSRRSEGEKARATAARLATAEADYAEWRARTANEEQLFQRFVQVTQLNQGDRQLTVAERQAALGEARLEFDRWATEQGLVLDEKRLDAYIASLTPTGGGGGTATNTSEIREIIKNDWGLNIGTMTQPDGTLGRVTVVGRDVAQITELNAIANDPNASEADRQRLMSEVQVLADRYGLELSPDQMMDPVALSQAVGQLINRELETSQNVAVGQLALYIRAWMSEGGGIPTAQDLGLARNDPLFTRALSQIEGFSTVEYALDDVRGAAEQRIWDYMTTMGPGGISSATIDEVYNRLVEHYGADAVTAAGYDDPDTLLDVVERKSVEMNRLFDGAAQIVGFVGNVMGVEDPLSADNIWDVQTAISEMPLLIARGQSLIEDLDSLTAFWQEVGGHGLFGANAEVQRKEYDFVQSIIQMGIPAEVLVDAGVFTPQSERSRWSFNRGAAREFVMNLNDVISQGTQQLVRYEGVLALRNSATPESEDSE